MKEYTAYQLRTAVGHEETVDQNQILYVSAFNSVRDLSLMNVFIASTQERCVLARRTAVNK